MKKSRNTVALIEFHDGGHNRTFFLAHIRALVECGCKVLAIAPFADEIKDVLTEEARASVVLKSNQADVKWAGRIKKYLRFLGGGLLEGLHFGNLIRVISKEAKKHEMSIEMCYFSCMYEASFAKDWFWKMFTPWSWSGLYLHIWGYRFSEGELKQKGRDFNPEDIFKSKKLHSLCVLDEGAVEWLENRIDKPVHIHPDLVDTTVDCEGEAFSESIKKRAKGRFTICLVGSLVPTKGLVEFLEIAQQLHAGLYFIIVGRMSRTTVDSIDWEYIVNASQGKIDNCWAHLDRIESEEAFNGVFLASDLVWAAYRAFPHSSNIQGKAAAFGKPCIVSKGYLMAERCKAYELGTVVEEGNITDLIAAINYYIDSDNLNRWKTLTRGDDYLKVQSYEQLIKMFKRILN